jgi:hypothetical protein
MIEHDSDRDTEAEGRFTEAVRGALRGSERFDVVTESKLRAARARALDAARAPPRAWRSPAAFASALLAIVAMASAWWLRMAPGADDPDIAPLEALDVLTDDLDPEFYQDLDLYRWLARPAADSAEDGAAHV